MSRKKMKNIYYNYSGEGSLMGLSYLIRHFPKYKKYWKKWLETQDTYTKTVPLKRKFLRRRYITSRLDYSFQADVAFLKTVFGIKLPTSNSDVSYLLVIVDMLSRYTYVYPLISKTSQEISDNIQKFLDKRKNKSISLMTDFGGEFYGKESKKLFNKYNVNHYSSKNFEIKSSIVERKIREIKLRIFKYISHTGNLNYVSKLNQIINSINKTVNKEIGLSPSEITDEHVPFIFQKLHLSQKKLKKPVYSIGDTVRITKIPQFISKESTSFKWSNEIFIIKKILPSHPITYSIRDFDMNVIEGSFYENELQKVNISQSSKHKFEILKTEKNRYYVHFIGFSDKYNQWISKRSVSILNN